MPFDELRKEGDVRLRLRVAFGRPALATRGRDAYITTNPRETQNAKKAKHKISSLSLKIPKGLKTKVKKRTRR